MILRLGREGTVVRIFKTRSAPDGSVEHNGRTRKLWATKMDKLAEIKVCEPVEAQMSNILDARGERIFNAKDFALVEEWVDQQIREIDAAFRRNQSLGLMGGTAVIKRSSSDDKRYEDDPNFIRGRKVGEFIGVIRDAHPYKPKLRKRIELPEIEINQALTVSKAWREGRLDDLATEILIRYRILAKDRGRKLHEALTEEDKQAIFTAGRVLTLFTYNECKKHQKDMMKRCEPIAKEKLAEIMAINISKAKKKLD